MNDEVRFRLLALVGLAVVGAAAGATGSALGIGGPVTDDPAAEFRVTDDNVTVADDDREAVVVEDMETVDTVRIADSGSGFDVRTHESEPLTDADRSRAKRIARGNGTVAGILEEGEYDLRVEAVRRIDARRSTAVSFEVNESALTAESEDMLLVENVTVEEDEEAVTVERSPSFVPDSAVVVLERPGENRRAYAVHVDLETGDVTRIVDHSRDGRN